MADKCDKIARDVCGCEYCRADGTFLCTEFGGCIAYRTVSSITFWKDKNPSKELINSICALFFSVEETFKKDNPCAVAWIRDQIKEFI
jgi:hypothetical protein